MSTLSNKLVAACMVTAISMVMYGCGGGGSSSSSTETNGGGTPPPMCAEGQTGTPPNCMTPPTEAEIAAAIEQAKSKATAIQAEATQGTDADLGGTNPAGTYTMTISRDSDGTTVMIADSALDGEDDPKFAQEMDLGDGTTMHTRTMGAMEEVVMVTTDIEAPKATPFAEVERLDARDLDATMDGPDEDDDGTNDWTALTLTGIEADGANLSKVMASAFDPVANVNTKTFAIDDPNTTDMDEADEFAGTYNGAEGTYRCNDSADCTATYAGGKLSALTGAWVFTPDAGATLDVADGEYMSYGFWLKRTTDKDGAVTYGEVETFAMVMGSTRNDAVVADGAVTGRATYTGGATGVYEHKVVNSDGTTATATSGYFTAKAELTAYFEQPTALADQYAPALENTVSGIINTFDLEGHTEGPGWSVSLDSTAIGGTDPHATGDATGGGNYQVTFYGGGGDNNDQPTSAVGEFNAEFTDGSVAGAFGATK